MHFQLKCENSSKERFNKLEVILDNLNTKTKKFKARRKDLLQNLLSPEVERNALGVVAVSDAGLQLGWQLEQELQLPQQRVGS